MWRLFFFSFFCFAFTRLSGVAASGHRLLLIATEEVTHHLLFVWERSPNPWSCSCVSVTDTGAKVTAGLISMLFVLAPFVTPAGTKADALKALKRTLAWLASAREA